MEELIRYEKELNDIQTIIGARNMSAIGINELANIYGDCTDLLNRLKSYLVSIAKDVDNLGIDSVEMILTSGKRLIDRISDSRLDVYLELTSKNEDINRLEDYLVTLRNQRAKEVERVVNIEKIVEDLKSVATDPAFVPYISGLEENIEKMKKSIKSLEEKQADLRDQQRKIVTGGEYKIEKKLGETNYYQENYGNEEYVGKHLKPSPEGEINFKDEAEDLKGIETKEDKDSIDTNIIPSLPVNASEGLPVPEGEDHEEVEESETPVAEPKEEEPEKVVPPASLSTEEPKLDVPASLSEEEAKMDVPASLSEENKEPAIVPEPLSSESTPESKAVPPAPLNDDDLYEIVETEQPKPNLWKKIATVTAAASAFLLAFLAAKTLGGNKEKNQPMDFDAEYQTEEKNTNAAVPPIFSGSAASTVMPTQVPVPTPAPTPTPTQTPKDEEKIDIKLEEGDMLIRPGEEVFDTSTNIGITADGTQRQYNQDHSYSVVGQQDLPNAGNNTSVVRNDAFTAPTPTPSQNMTEEQARANMTPNQQAQLDSEIGELDWDSIFNEQNNLGLH